MSAVSKATAPSSMSTHPLEIIPFFRRYPRSWWRAIIYTLIWNTLIAVVLTGVIGGVSSKANIAEWLRINWIFANCIGYFIHFGFVVADRLAGDWIRSQSLAARLVSFGGIPVAGVFAGYWLGLELLDVRPFRIWVFSPSGVISITIMSLIVSAILAAIFFSRERAAKLEAAYLREQARAMVSDKAATDARFRMLQAQIEPHFLFNTLANVVSLIDPAPAKAKQMLEDFIAFLRASLSVTRAERLTLRQEVEMIEAYLRLIQLRMGDRLRYRLDVAQTALDLPFPPMLLQPLVENAIKHGLEPNITGGEILVKAGIDHGDLRISVADSGLGLETPVREGVGLSNVRERLSTLYGAGAVFDMTQRSPAGTEVTITIPMDKLDA